MTLIPILTFIESGFNGTFAMGVTCQEGTLTLSDTWFRPLLGLAYAQVVETSFPDLAVSFPYFSPQISLGTLSILLIKRNRIFIRRGGEDAKPVLKG